MMIKPLLNKHPILILFCFIYYLIINISITEALLKTTSILSPSRVTTTPSSCYQLRKQHPIQYNNLCGTSSALTSSNNIPYSSSKNSLLSRSPLFLKNYNHRDHIIVNRAVASSSSVPDTSSSSSDDDNNNNFLSKRTKWQKEGGLLSFNTPAGALNPYGIIYGSTAIGLGFIWYILTMTWKLIHNISGKRFDKMCRIPIFIAQCWGTSLMKLTFSWPKIENRQILKDFYKTNRAAMVVANHNSWQDIPYLGMTVGWKNYKIIAKKELLKVPILGTAISAGGHVVIDRTNRKSQLMTLKSGINWLKNGVLLCAFPEGTRSKTGKLQIFKKGAFKMAYKAGVPVIPISICGAAKAQPSNWMFPINRGKGVKVVVHEPVESVGRTEEELAEIVREKIISGLPDDQRP